MDLMHVHLSPVVLYQNDPDYFINGWSEYLSLYQIRFIARFEKVHLE